jgi:glutamate---cysteine ligase / carboxylate-amine ligase
VLQHEWLNSRGAIARFSRNAIEIRVMDVQECPLADVALAALIIDVVQALYEERYATLAPQQAVPTAVLSRVLAACVANGERAQISEPEYLRTFGVHGGISAGELWRRIAERLGANGARHHALWARPADIVLTRGPLARRLLDVLGRRPSRGDMHAVYRELSDRLAAGSMYLP